MVPNHSAASTNHFHLFHKSSCCKHHPAPTIRARLRYATLGSPPPLGRPSTERPLCVSVSLPIPPLSSLLPWRTGGFLSGWVEASLGATLHGDCFISNQELISLTCDQTELSVAYKLLTGQLLDHHSSISPGDMWTNWALPLPLTSGPLWVLFKKVLQCWPMYCNLSEVLVIISN